MAGNKKSIIGFRKLLKDNKFKNTPSRLSILEVFEKNDKPLSADFIYSKLKGTTNEATVFRTLSSFEKTRIIRRVDLRKDSVCFELNNDHHHHMVCLKCGQIEDFKENRDIEKLLDQIVDKSIKFRKITEHSLELFGFCKMCYSYDN